MIRVSVPGKIHLIGEHSVVYGEPAIIAAVGMRTIVEAEKAGKVFVNNMKLGSVVEWDVEEAKSAAKRAQEAWEMGNGKKDFSEVFSMVKGMDFTKVGIGFILDKLGIESGVKITADTELPLGSGLGSSSSYSVALAKAISEAYYRKLSLEEINSLAYGIEKFRHGNPSGGDNSTCCFGGLVWFKKGIPNTIDSLREEIPYKLENFVLVYTKEPEKSTGELVSFVRNLDERFREERVKALGKATHEMRMALKNRDFGKVKELMNLAQKNLMELGVSIPEIDRIAEGVKGIGGAAKLCGAGGGGIVLCYHEDKKRLVNKIKELGFEPMEAELAVPGCAVV